MLRSLYSAISGLKNHQTKMDIVGNNIANVNTTGFKRSRVTFSTMLSQNLKEAASPDAAATPTYGGTNPMQIGSGSNVASIDQIMTQGSTQSTGNPTDMLIQGSGFFVLKNQNDTVYTRCGTFTQDSSGNLVDPASGSFVQGYSFDTSQTNATSQAEFITPVAGTYGNIKFLLGGKLPPDTGTLADTAATPPEFALTSYSIDQNGVITGVFNDGTTSQTQKIAQIAVAQFPNDSGLQSIGSNFYKESSNSGPAVVYSAGKTGRGSIVPGAVEMSNVDLSQEFTDMIIAQRGFQANSRVITVSDSLLQELIDLKRQ